MSSSPSGVDPRVVPRATRSLALAAAAIVGCSSGSSDARRGPSLCDDVNRLGGVWDASVASAVKTRFAAARSYGAETAERVTAALDARAARWLASWRETCDATWVRHAQTEASLDLRLACLDRGAGTLGALAALFAATTDGAVVDGAVRAVSELDDASRCDDVGVLAAVLPPPPAQADAIAVLRARLDVVRAGRLAGALDAVFREADAIVEAAHSIPDPAVQGEAYAELGFLLDAAADATSTEPTLVTALQAATAAHDVVTEVAVWRTLIVAIARGTDRLDEALALVPRANAAVERAGNRLLDAARMLIVETYVRARRAEWVYARAAVERAIDLLAQAGADPYEQAGAAGILGNVLAAAGVHASANKASVRASELYEQSLGPSHPDVARALAAAGWNALAAGDPAEAERYGRDALKRMMSGTAPDAGDAINALQLLGDAARERGDPAREVEVREREVSLVESSVAPDHPLLARSLTHQGAALVAAGRAGEAVAPLERALAIGGDARAIALMRYHLARALWDAPASPDRRRARSLAEQARAVLETGGDDPSVAALKAWVQARP